MNNKIELFKLTIAAGSEKYTEEQIKFLVECFKKADKLSTPTDHVNKSYQTKGLKTGSPKIKGPKPLTGRYLFIGDKLGELRSNGLTYPENKNKAVEAWKKLSQEDKKGWDNKAQGSEIEHPKTKGPKILTGRYLFIGDKLGELKGNGFTYLENKKKAGETWTSLSEDEKEIWNDKVPEIEGPKTLVGRFLFIKEKLAELKNNGRNYKENKNTVDEAWENLSEEDKKNWDEKALSSK